MIRIIALFAVASCVGFGQQAKKDSFNLPQGNKSAFPALPDALDGIPPQRASAFPETPPDRFDFGRLSSFNEVHDSEIKELQQRVRDIEASVNWGRGVVAGALVLVIGLGTFLKAFWKSILRLIVTEATAKNTTPPGAQI